MTDDATRTPEGEDGLRAALDATIRQHLAHSLVVSDSGAIVCLVDGGTLLATRAALAHPVTPSEPDAGLDVEPSVLNGSWLPIVEMTRLRAIEAAAREVVRLGNQPGLDDDEWESAFTAMEEALR